MAMARPVALGLLIVLIAACGARSQQGTRDAAVPRAEIVLYRDRALVRQRVELDVPPAGSATVRVAIAAGVAVDDVHVVERDRYQIRELRSIGDPDPGRPSQIELVVGAPRPGRHAIHLAYLTDRITWDVAYTLTATPARDRVVTRGVLAIRNTTGIAMPAMAVRVIDAELSASIRRASEVVETAYVGKDPTTTDAEAVPRDVGRVDLVDGETRVELLRDAQSRPMRSVLVYDPIGSAENRATVAPVRDYDLGAGPASPHVIESYEIARDPKARGLPGGPVRLLERRADGSLVLLGQGRMFDASTRAAKSDTIGAGTAQGVTGHRERREYTYDAFRKRLVEEFVITIDNRRPRPVEVIVREHLYRGTTWRIADPIYAQRPVKEGLQQFSMRTTVPPRSRSQLLYVVVYPW
jgi:hypothetical protein